LSPPKASTGIIIFALWLLVFSASSQIMIITPILPLIGQELGIGESRLGMLVSAYAIMVGVFAIVAGPVSDKIGRRRILLLGTAVMTVSLLMHYFVEGYFSFLAARLFTGSAGGILSGSAVSYIGDFFPYHRRGWATGWVMSGMAFGQIAGIPIGIVMAGTYGFKVPFYLFAVAMGATFLLIWFRVPQPDVQRAEGPLTVASAVRNYRAMLAKREIAAAATAYFTMFVGVSLFVVYLPYWLEQSLGVSSNAIAGLFVVGGIANVLTGPQAGKLSDRIGRKRIIIMSSVGLSLVMLLTTVLVREFWAAYVLYFVLMVLVAARLSPFSALLTALVSDERRGTLMSMTIALGQIGFAVGAAAAGPMYGRFGFASNTVLGAVAVLIMAGIIAYLVPEPESRDDISVVPATVL
jgi:predicted MFS family arabinose efflux permease|tara:strand:- start:3491 stop:4714 length:1224 start_codon:yes stop_codon:yes gene_type:complete